MPRIPGKHSPNWGGARPNSGPKVARIDAYCRQLLKDAYESGDHPFAYLLKKMRDKKQDDKTRMMVANMLLPYCMPKQAQVQMNVTSEVSNLSLEEKVALAQSVRNRILEHNPDVAIPELPNQAAVIEYDT